MSRGAGEIKVTKFLPLPWAPEGGRAILNRLSEDCPEDDLVRRAGIEPTT
jgi:hypothetical protein